jgi:hypothetical protein
MRVGDTSRSCSICRSASELLRARPLIDGFELRDYPCPKCGGMFKIVVKIDEAPLPRAAHNGASGQG